MHICMVFSPVKFFRFIAKCKIGYISIFQNDVNSKILHWSLNLYDSPLWIDNDCTQKSHTIQQWWVPAYLSWSSAKFSVFQLEMNTSAIVQAHNWFHQMRCWNFVQFHKQQTWDWMKNILEKSTSIALSDQLYHVTVNEKQKQTMDQSPPQKSRQEWIKQRLNYFVVHQQHYNAYNKHAGHKAKQ